MKTRTRQAIAGVGIVVFLIAYVMLVSQVGQALPQNRFVTLLFYAVAGIGWGIPLLPLIKWAAKKE